MYAYVDAQPTVINDTAVCSVCFSSAIGAPTNALTEAPFAFVDCTGNGALWCRACGWQWKRREIQAVEHARKGHMLRHNTQELLRLLELVKDSDLRRVL